MPEQPLRVLVDTNVWVSAFINPQGPPARVLEAFLDGRFVPVVSQALLDEIRDVINRPRIQRIIRSSPQDVERLLTLLHDEAVHVAPSGGLHLCRDPKDDFLLESAILGGAQVAVSRDDDLKRDLDLIAHLQAQGVTVLSVAQFLELMANRSS